MTGISLILPEKKIISKIKIDWHEHFRLSGDTASCNRFKDIINKNLFNGERTNCGNDELLELVTIGSVILESIVDFQKKAEGKYKIEKKKAIIIDKQLDEIPYGNLSSLLKNDPKACLKSYQTAINHYMMQKYHVARYLCSGILEGEIITNHAASKRCIKDYGRIVKLKIENFPIPHHLGCTCSIRPVIKF